MSCKRLFSFLAVLFTLIIQKEKKKKEKKKCGGISRNTNRRQERLVVGNQRTRSGHHTKCGEMAGR